MSYLLAPAGNAKCLIAAVQNGADEIYLGLSDFNARAVADNFTVSSLEPFVRYAHVRGVKIHVTLNTLLYNNEIEKAAALAKEADKIGVDAFIVQDVGLMRKLAGNVGADLHASTQMTIMNKYGLMAAKELGFSRAVLARELSIPEIEELSGLGIMETEVFCHGALCMIYSGQCMLSFATTGRSGNRGTCSQPCRLNYKRDGEALCKAILSPKDLCTLSYIDKLVATGVSSLKIEGRLKSPEYVAAVTRAYRMALDHKTENVEEEIKKLSVIFTRGFCSGHQLCKLPLSDITLDYAGRTGLPCGKITGNISVNRGKITTYKVKASVTENLSVGDGITFYGLPDNGGIVNVIEVRGEKVRTLKSGESGLVTICGNPPKPGFADFYKTLDFLYDKEISSTITMEKEYRKVPVVCELQGDGEYVHLSISDGKNMVSKTFSGVKDGENEEYKRKATEAISGTGNTPFVVTGTEIDTKGLFVPYSALKQGRRELIEELSKIREKRGNI